MGWDYLEHVFHTPPQRSQPTSETVMGVFSGQIIFEWKARALQDKTICPRPNALKFLSNISQLRFRKISLQHSS